MRVGWSVPLPGPFRVSGNVGLPRAYRRSAAQKNRDAAARAVWKAERSAERQATRDRQRREGFTRRETADQCLALLFLALLLWGWLRPVSIICLVLIPLLVWGQAAQRSSAAAKTPQQTTRGEAPLVVQDAPTPQDAPSDQYWREQK